MFRSRVLAGVSLASLLCAGTDGLAAGPQAPAAAARRPLKVVHQAPVQVPVGLNPALKRVEVQLDAAVAADGAVSDAKLVSVSVVGPKVEIAGDPDAVRKDFDALVTAASASVRQWRFEAPATAPASVRVPIRFDLSGSHAVVGSIRPLSGYPPTVTAVPPSDALRVGGAVAAPKKIVNVPPRYPQAAMDAKIQGEVVLQLTVDPEGVPTDVEVVESVPELDQAAIDAVKQWRYEPTLMNGAPVPVAMLVTLTFSLEQR